MFQSTLFRKLRWLQFVTIIAILYGSEYRALASETAAIPVLLTENSEFILFGNSATRKKHVRTIFSSAGTTIAKISVVSPASPIDLHIYDESNRKLESFYNLPKAFEREIIIGAGGVFFRVNNNKSSEDPAEYKGLQITWQPLEFLDKTSSGNNEAGGGRENNWFQASELAKNANVDKKDRQTIESLRNGVVRVQVPFVPICNQYLGGKIRPSRGCSGWRVSKDIFATNWHCLPSPLKNGISDSCNNSSITFGYRPPVNRAEKDSRNWGYATERCKKILYSNKRLDIALFRVSTDEFNKWKLAPKLRVLSGHASYPQTTNATERYGDRLAVIQYPQPRSCRNYFENDSYFDAYLGDDASNEFVTKSWYQTSQRVSLFDKKTNPWCRVWVTGFQSGGKKRKLRLANTPVETFKRGTKAKGYINVPLGVNHNPETSCERRLRSDAPSIGLLHRCDTCSASSGSPLISLQKGTVRYGTVVGIHAGAFGGTTYIGNFAIRMSKISECIDLGLIREKNEIVFSPNSSSKPHCKALAPIQAPHRDCGSKIDGDCRYYSHR